MYWCTSSGFSMLACLLRCRRIQFTFLSWAFLVPILSRCMR